MEVNIVVRLVSLCHIWRQRFLLRPGFVEQHKNSKLKLFWSGKNYIGSRKCQGILFALTCKNPVMLSERKKDLSRKKKKHCRENVVRGKTTRPRTRARSPTITGIVECAKTVETCCCVMDVHAATINTALSWKLSQRETGSVLSVWVCHIEEC